MIQTYEQRIYNLLKGKYGNVRTALNFSNPLELLVATILSAQCTDKRVNIVTEKLFKKYKSASDYTSAVKLTSDIKSINFFNNKSKNIRNMAGILVREYGGKVPNTMDDLLKLPGVARKTANVVLSNAFGKNEGVVVDTHVRRVSNRLGLVSTQNVRTIENELMNKFDRENWSDLSHLFITLGRDVCMARKPICERCVLNKICPSSLVK